MYRLKFLFADSEPRLYIKPTGPTVSSAHHLPMLLDHHRLQLRLKLGGCPPPPGPPGAAELLERSDPHLLESCGPSPPLEHLGTIGAPGAPGAPGALGAMGAMGAIGALAPASPPGSTSLAWARKEPVALLAVRAVRTLSRSC